jgi:hypothetical protein
MNSGDVRQLAAAILQRCGTIVAIQDSFDSMLIRAFERDHPKGAIVRQGDAIHSPKAESIGIEYRIPAHSRILGKASPSLIREMQSKLRAECRRVGYKAPLVFHPGPWYRVIED